VERVGLSAFANHYPHELSVGMRQRLGIGRAMVVDAPLLLMDEPFGALDAQARERLQEELVGIWRRTGTTIVFITHDIEEAVFLGQRVAVMSSRPGAIRKVIDIRLDRSAAGDEDIRASQAFASYRHQVWTLLRDRRSQHSEVASVA
jgi:NitT/TauT family transport system ATP-binding protein